MPQIIHGYSSSAPSTSVANFTQPAGAGTSWASTDAPVSIPVPTNGQIDRLYIAIDVAPTTTSGKSRDFEIYINGAASGIKATVVDTGLTASDTTTVAVSVSQGQTISIVTTPHGSPTAPGNIRWSFRFTPTTSGERIEFGGQAAALTGSINFAPTFGGSNATETNIYSIVPENCTIKSLFMKTTAAQGAGLTATLTTRRNILDAVDSNNVTGNSKLEVVLSNATSGNVTGASCSFTAGDQLTFKLTASGTLASESVYFSYVYTCATPANQFLMNSHSNQATLVTTIQYSQPDMSGASWGATAASSSQVTQKGTLEAIYGRIVAAPGAANVRLTVFVNGVASAVLVNCTGSGPGFSATGFSVAVNDGDVISVEVNPTSGSPAAARVMSSILFQADPGITTVSKNIGAASAGVGVAIIANPQVLRPQVIVSGTWRSSDGTPAKVSEINELTPNDATYLASGYHPVNDTERVRLQGGNPPLPGNGTLRVRYKKDVVPGIEGMDLTVKLYSAGTLILTRTYTGIGTVVEDDYTLSSGETAAITDYNTIEIEMVANHQ